MARGAQWGVRLQAFFVMLISCPCLFFPLETQLYTTKLDKSTIPIEKQREAEKIAAEIERGKGKAGRRTGEVISCSLCNVFLLLEEGLFYTIPCFLMHLPLCPQSVCSMKMVAITLCLARLRRRRSRRLLHRTLPWVATRGMRRSHRRGLRLRVRLSIQQCCIWGPRLPILPLLPRRPTQGRRMTILPQPWLGVRLPTGGSCRRA